MLFPISLIMIEITKSNPNFIEQFYSLGIYIPISKTLSSLTSFTDFSIFELFVYSIVLFAIFYVIKTIIKVIKHKNKIFNLTKSALTICSITSILYFCFTIFWALNYYRLPLKDVLDYDVRPSTTVELKQMCDSLVQTANKLRPLVSEDENGVFKLTNKKQSALSDVNNIFLSLNDNRFSIPYANPKKVLLSKGLSNLNITGIYSPFTSEANVNMDIPDLKFMATACHEAAHQHGYAREDEANYIAWYAIMNASDNIEYQYSAVIHALVYSTNALYGSSPEHFNEVIDKYSDGVKRDLNSHKIYWDAYDTKAAEVHETVNNYYLKSNNQEDGVKSYGRMVDLLLGEFRTTGFEY